MEPLESERKVIAAAEALAETLGSDINHTVAAAAMDTNGRIYKGVNVHHFTGGPCAELVTMGVAAAAQAGPLVAMAAAADRGRGLLPPCGRCRQVMLDLHPDVLVAVPTSEGPRMRPLSRLLGEAYIHPDSDAQRILRFHKRYYDALANGQKTSSVRWGEQITVGPALFYFEDDDVHAPLHGHILEVQRYRLSELTTERLRLGEGENVAGYIEALHKHYPLMPADAEVDVVDLRITTP